MLMRAVQCEMQQSLGGQLTNVCMAGMSLLQPMETMVSYVMSERQRGTKSARKPLGAVMAQLEVRRLQKFLSPIGFIPMRDWCCEAGQFAQHDEWKLGVKVTMLLD